MDPYSCPTSQTFMRIELLTEIIGNHDIGTRLVDL